MIKVAKSTIKYQGTRVPGYDKVKQMLRSAWGSLSDRIRVGIEHYRIGCRSWCPGARRGLCLGCSLPAPRQQCYQPPPLHYLFYQGLEGIGTTFVAHPMLLAWESILKVVFNNETIGISLRC